MDIKEKIYKLKKERNATILAHSYQLPEIQDIADFVGDSLGLSIQASKTDADIIVFCGVYFMAETAKIISPDKKVLIPDKDAGCPMADMVTAKELKEFKKIHPDAKYVCYVNSTAEVKAECDLCVTSANALDLVAKFYTKEEKIVFLPDKYLGQYVSEKTGYDFIKWNGYCPTHLKIMPEDILSLKKEHPDAKVIVHPECAGPVWKLADEVLSTEGMYRYARDAKEKEFIVGTEIGMIYRLLKDNPGKVFYPATKRAICPNMKKITLQKVLFSLEEQKYEVNVDQKVMAKAKKCIDKMLASVG